MSRLINPGVGDISDRLSILALKILCGQEAGREVGHFETERAALLVKIHGRTLNGKWFDAYTELAAVNALLWHAEDDLRALRLKAVDVSKADLDAVVLLAFRVQVLNDRRAELVRTINADAGDGDIQEKNR